MDGSGGYPMEQTLDHRSQVEGSDAALFDDADPTDDDVVEFATYIRERPVTCHWENGRVTGDRELMDRLARMVVAKGWTEHPATVARTISCAVANPVTIRIVGRRDLELNGGVPVPPCPSPRGDGGVLGDYWLG